MTKFDPLYSWFLQNRKEAGLCRSLKGLGQDGRDYLNFSSNDYLGLSQHPALTQRAQDWAARYGAGAGASRLVTGNLDVYAGLEQKLADFKGQEAALIMASGFQANATVLPALFNHAVLGAEPLVFADKLNHASMHHGCAAAGVKQIRYRHLDMAHLEELLDKHCDDKRPAFILSETVFSMDGDVADVTALSHLAKKYNAMLVLDEAHATGVLGPRGHGLAPVQADVVIGTFSKAMGGFGAYVACSQTLKNYLVNACGGVVYSTSLPPSVLGAIDAALDIVPGMGKERDHVASLAAQFRDFLNSVDLGYGQSQTHIVPIYVGDTQTCLSFADQLYDQRILGVAIRPPTVPKNTARIRISFSAAHTQDNLQTLMQAIESIPYKRAA